MILAGSVLVLALARGLLKPFSQQLPFRRRAHDRKQRGHP